MIGAAGALGGWRPGLNVVDMTGNTTDFIVHDCGPDFDADLESKPFTVAELGAERESALAAAPSEAVTKA